MQHSELVQPYFLGSGRGFPVVIVSCRPRELASLAAMSAGAQKPAANKDEGVKSRVVEAC